MTDFMQNKLNSDFYPELPDDIVNRISQLNKDYLVLLREVSRRDPSAAAMMGLSEAMIEAFSNIELNKLISISSLGISLVKLRFSDLSLWQHLVKDNEEITVNQLIYRLLKESD